MAVIWEKQYQGSKYEVRSAGRSRRLYTNGVFHSQYNPGRVITGGIWDLLMVPAFFTDTDKIKRILVLGVGGGAVIHQFKRFLNPEEIIGVELNPIHIQVAKRFFGLNQKIASLYESDAVAWLKQYKGKPFDLIVEDLFGEKDGEPIRAVEPSKEWMELLEKNMSKDGILIMNFIGNNAVKTSAGYKNKSLAKKFVSVFQLRMPIYDNAIGVFTRFSSSSSTLRDNLKAHPKLATSIKNNSLSYTIKQFR
jgi:spermidine synthase